MKPASENKKGRFRIVVAAGIALSSLIAIVVMTWGESSPSSEQLLAGARRDLARSRFQSAFEKSTEAIRQGDTSLDAPLIAGEAAMKLEKLNDALKYFDLVGDEGEAKSSAARRSSASIYLHQHEPGLAEDQLMRALEIAPGDSTVHRMLSQSLGLQGRRFDSIKHLQFAIYSGDIDLESLCYLADTDRTVELSEDQLSHFIQSEDPRPKQGAACVAISYRNYERAEELLRECIAEDPELVEAHARVGKLLLSGSRSSELPDWERSLPETANGHPEIWFIRSQWCLNKGNAEQAASCLAKALKLHPNHPAANHQMAQTLTLLGRVDLAEDYRQRGVTLTRISKLANDVYLGDVRSKTLREMAESMESLERIPEALGWVIAAKHESPAESWPVAMEARLQSSLANFMKSGGSSIETELDGHLADLQLAWQPPVESRDPVKQSLPTDSASATHIAFQDATERSGIAARYFNGEDLSTEGRLMFEYTGGGVGVIDINNDAWPDLYLTQAGATPPFQRQTSHADSLWRNRDGVFDDIAALAKVQDYGFGQGISVGDINNDGFEDLYIANIDGNRLYINMGDGTFEDATDEAGLGHPFWTTSVAIADLNCDSIPDIYDVTFLGEDDVFTRICEEDGVKRSCAPAGFQAADDYLYQGAGDGSFSDVSKSSGILAPDGDGLGILIADFAGTGRPDIFIANDGRANFLFRQNSDAKSKELAFQESALSSGVAFDRDGRAQACMGIASSDFNGDGQYDFFVTNFFNESNTLYSQYGNAVFGDASQQAGIREPSMSMLGFGTQALDADLDGFDDLMITNGHVDNFEYKNIPYRMPLEIFRNTGMASFEKVNSESAGSIFSTPMLGRSMAILDWNRDGRAEVAISRLEDSALLLENTTEQPGSSITIRLVGTLSARDATTTQVTATVGERQIVRQLTGGDGYLSSNEKQIIIGLGDAQSVDQLLVRWPGGHEQSFTDLQAGHSYTVVEGLDQAVVIP